MPVLLLWGTVLGIRYCCLMVLLSFFIAHFISSYIDCWEIGIEVFNCNCEFVYFSCSYISFCFMYFMALSFGVYMYVGFVVDWSFYNYIMSYFIPGGLLSSEVTLSDISIISPAFFWLAFVWYIILHLSSLTDLYHFIWSEFLVDSVYLGLEGSNYYSLFYSYFLFTISHTPIFHYTLFVFMV